MYKPKKIAKQVHDDSISLNKYISDTGFCSRREADEYIAQARVTINEELAAQGNRVYAGDVVEIDGEPIVKKVKTVYIAFNKPKGVTSTTDKKDKTNIVDYIGYKQRIFPIGRLDKDSEGLIFLTNDGNIVNKILRAGNQHEKEYTVAVDKPVTPEFLKNMSEGVRIEGGMTKPCKVVQEAKSIIRITLTQGMNRQIRRMCQALNYKVVRLKRLRVMNIHLGNLDTGRWRYLTPDEIIVINKMLSSSSNTEEASIIKRTRTAEKKPTPAKQVQQPKKQQEDQNGTREKKKKSFKEYRDLRKKR